MENNTQAKQQGFFKSYFAALVMPIALAAAIIIYFFVLGNPVNFQGSDSTKDPLPGNYLGIIYKGGMIVPLLITLLMLVLTFSIERFFTISKATGKGNIDTFIHKVRGFLMQGNIDAASKECDAQQGSVANVIKSGLKKYKEMDKEQGMDKDHKVLAIQKDIEEATELELPMLEKNLVIIATISSIATLIGLLGTVLGMIRSFAALAQAGAPDSVALASGISEALINTALGITTSALAIIAYNLFTSKIDKLTYSIDEAGFSIIQTFATTRS